MANVSCRITSIEAPGLKIEGQLLHRMRSEVAELLQRKNLGFPGAQPVSFARKHLEELTATEYVFHSHGAPQADSAIVIMSAKSRMECDISFT